MKVFKLFDEDGTGKISFKNIKKISHELGRLPLLHSLQAKTSLMTKSWK